MMTECNRAQLEFHAVGRREVTGRFDGRRITSDGGGLLLREVDLRLGLMARLANCFVDYRNRQSIEHSVQSLVAQRVYGLALGYEDLNDHDVLHADSLLALLVGKAEVTGEARIRDRNKSCPLAGFCTLNRLELSEPDGAAHSRYKRIVADPEALEWLLVDLFIESCAKPPREIWLDLDLDATDNPLHGHQKGHFFHGYYGCYCYLPLYIFCGEHLLCARLASRQPRCLGGQRGGAGPCASDRDPAEAAEDRNTPADHNGAQGMVVVLLSISVCERLSADPGESAAPSLWTSPG